MISFLILINIVGAFELQNFQVDFLGISAANVQMHTIDTVYHNHNSKLIHFKTESTGLIKYFFNIDNSYETIISNDFNTILSFKKKTKQPNVKNNFETSRLKKETIYNNSSIIIPKNYVNIFSLLYFLSYNQITDIKQFDIEREGKFYIGKIIPVEILDNNRILYHLELEKNNALKNKSVVKNTDIFTWALFKDNAKREILIDYNMNDIISCIFQMNGITMTAYNTKYNK